MSEITSLNQLWGKRWKLKNDIQLVEIPTSPESYYLTADSSTLQEPIGRYIYDVDTAKEMYICNANTNTSRVIRVQAYTVYKNIREFSLSFCYQRDYSTFGSIFNTGTSATNGAGEWASWGTKPRVFEFYEQPSGVQFLEDAKFLAWWNLNTVPFTIEDEFKWLFTDISDEIRAKDGTTALIPPLYLPSRVAALETGTTPTGTIEITSNGDHDVTNYATASVNVPIPEGYIVPEGTITITANGTHNVTNYAAAEVNIAGGIEITPVSNVKVNEAGIITWDASEVSASDYETSISYIVTINNSTTVSTNVTSLDSLAYLQDGENTVEIVTKVIVHRNNGVSTVTYTMPVSEVVTLTSLPKTMRMHSAAIVGSNVYIIGGIAGSSGSKTIYKYNLNDQTTTTISGTLSGLRNAISACEAVDDNIYALGGGNSTTNLITKIDTVSETVTNLGTTLSASTSGGCGALANRCIYVFGGYGLEQKIQKYDVDNNVITTLSTTLPQKISYAGAESVGETIYIFGGYNGSSCLNTIYKFDTTTNTITTLSATLPVALQMIAVTCVGNNIFIFGGHNGSAAVNTIYKFDTTTETISNTGYTLPSITRYIAGVSKGLNSYLFGGCGTSTSDTVATVVKATII